MTWMNARFLSSPVAAPWVAALALSTVLCGCANADTTPPGSTEVRERVASLVVRDSAGTLRIVHAVIVDASEIGDRDVWNGIGVATYRWRLLDASDAVVDSGDIVAATRRHSPPGPGGEPPVDVPLDPVSFSARVPYPKPGQSISIETIDGDRSTRWRP